MFGFGFADQAFKNVNQSNRALSNSTNGSPTSDFTRQSLFRSEADRELTVEENERRIIELQTRTGGGSTGELSPAERSQANNRDLLGALQGQAINEASATRQVLLDRSRQREDEQANLRALTLGL